MRRGRGATRGTVRTSPPRGRRAGRRTAWSPSIDDDRLDDTWDDRPVGSSRRSPRRGAGSPSRRRSRSPSPSRRRRSPVRHRAGGSRSPSPIRGRRREARPEARRRGRGARADEGRAASPPRGRLPQPGVLSDAYELEPNPSQPLEAFEGDEQLVLENFFRKHAPDKTSKEIYEIRRKAKDFRSLCNRLAELHGDPDPLAMWKQPMHGHKSRAREKTAGAARPRTVAASMVGSPRTLQAAARAAGKQMSKGVAEELRIEEAKKQIRRATYDPTEAARGTGLSRDDIDYELRENGFDGIDFATPEQVKEAKLRLMLRTKSQAAATGLWTETSLRRLRRRRAEDHDVGVAYGLDIDEFREAVRRFGKVSKKILPDAELKTVFDRIDVDGDGQVTPDECQQFTDSPPSARLQSWLKSAGSGELQYVQKVSTSNSQLGRLAPGDGGWAFIPTEGKSSQENRVRVIELDQRQQDKLWKDCDFNDNGKVSLAELQKGILMHAPDGWGGMDSKEAIALAYKQADLDWSGYIVRDEFDTFLKFVVFFSVLWKLFEEMDGNEDGRLSPSEFLSRCEELGVDMRDTDGMGHFAEIDRDGTGTISFSEFCTFVAECTDMERWSWAEVVEWCLNTQSEPTTHISEAVVCRLSSRELDELWSLWDVRQLNALSSGEAWTAYCRDPPVDWFGIDNEQAFNLAFSSAVGKGSDGLMKRERLTIFLKHLVYFHVLWDAIGRADPSFPAWMAQTQLREINFDELVEWFEEHRDGRPHRRGARRSTRLSTSTRLVRTSSPRSTATRPMSPSRRETSRVSRTRALSPTRARGGRSEEFSVVVRIDRRNGLGIICDSEGIVTGFRGHNAEDAGVTLGAQIISVDGIDLTETPGTARQAEELDILKDIVDRIAVGEDVTLILSDSPRTRTRIQRSARTVSPSRRRSVSPTRRRSTSPRRRLAHGGRQEQLEDELNSRLQDYYAETSWLESWSNGELATRDADGEELVDQLAEELRAAGGGRRASSADGFEDHFFPPTDASIYSSRRHAGEARIVWARLHEIRGAELYGRSREMDPEDVQPSAQASEVDNAYFLAALSMLASQSRGTRRGSVSDGAALLRDLIVDSGADQGVFGVKFFTNGMWRTVLVDDFIPCTEGRDGLEPMFADSGRDFALWPFIFVKAFAKLLGSYEATSGGTVHDALNYLTGGLCTPIALKDPAVRRDRSARTPLSPSRRRSASDPWDELVDATSDRDDEFPVFVTATLTQPPHASTREADAWERDVEELGLEPGQAYEVLGAHELSGREQLVCLSSWSGSEYRGEYGRSSERGRAARSELQRQRLPEPLLGDGAKDGEFWISLDEFSSVFTEVGVCDPWTSGCLNTSTEHGRFTLRSTGAGKMEVNLQAARGTWVAGVSAGGSIDDETFQHNPTFELDCDGDYATFALYSDPRMESAGPETISLYLVTEHDRASRDGPQELELVTVSAHQRQAGTKAVRLPRGGRHWLVAAADAPGVVGEFWLTASAKNCRLNPCSASRPTSEDADDMMQERARRGYRR